MRTGISRSGPGMRAILDRATSSVRVAGIGGASCMTRRTSAASVDGLDAREDLVHGSSMMVAAAGSSGMQAGHYPDPAGPDGPSGSVAAREERAVEAGTSPPATSDGGGRARRSRMGEHPGPALRAALDFPDDRGARRRRRCRRSTSPQLAEIMVRSTRAAIAAGPRAGGPGVDLGAEHPPVDRSPRSASSAPAACSCRSTPGSRATRRRTCSASPRARMLFTVTDFLDTDYVADAARRRG